MSTGAQTQSTPDQKKSSFVVSMAGTLTKKEFHDLFHVKSTLERRGSVKMKHNGKIHNMDVGITIERTLFDFDWYFSKDTDKALDGVFTKLGLARGDTMFYLEDHVLENMHNATETLHTTYVESESGNLETFLEHNAIFKAIKPIKEYHAQNLAHSSRLGLTLRFINSEIMNGTDLENPERTTEWINQIDNPDKRKLTLDITLVNFDKSRTLNVCSIVSEPNTENELVIKSPADLSIHTHSIAALMGTFSELSLEALDNLTA